MADAKVNGYVTKEDLAESLAAVETRLNQKIGGVDQKVGALDQKINKVAVTVAQNQGQMKQMEDRLSDQMRGLESRLLKTVEDFMVKAEKVDRQGVLHGHKLEADKTRFAADGEKRSTLGEGKQNKPRRG